MWSLIPSLTNLFQALTPIFTMPTFLTHSVDPIILFEFCLP